MEAKSTNQSGFIADPKIQPLPFHEVYFSFSFEENFDTTEHLKWMQAHWSDSIYWAIAYGLLVLAGRVGFV